MLWPFDNDVYMWGLMDKICMPTKIKYKFKNLIPSRTHMFCVNEKNEIFLWEGIPNKICYRIIDNKKGIKAKILWILVTMRIPPDVIFV